MPETVLVTGGAGFIGRHVVAGLLTTGHRVRVLDALIEQAHYQGGAPNLPDEVEFIEADIRDEAALDLALRGADSLIHLAAEVGVGQSMYQVQRYVETNEAGAATLLQKLLNRPVRRMVLASSMSVYGEGLYRDVEGRLYEDVIRTRADAAWDPCDAAGRPLAPLPTPESKRPALASVYALNKFAQEQLFLILGQAYGIETVALRIWNAYGPGQALSNPYTGVLANFASRLLHGRAPLVFEDGRQRRDFVHVADVAQAFLLALFQPGAGGVYNIGSGVERTVSEAAELLARAMDRPELAPEITGRARAGDIRHCIPDIAKARAELGYAPARDFGRSLAELAAWVERQDSLDRSQEARRELEARGLFA